MAEITEEEFYEDYLDYINEDGEAVSLTMIVKKAGE